MFEKIRHNDPNSDDYTVSYFRKKFFFNFGNIKIIFYIYQKLKKNLSFFVKKNRSLSVHT